MHSRSQQSFSAMVLRIVGSILFLNICTAALGQAPIPGTSISISESLVSDSINNSPNKTFETLINLEPVQSSGSAVEIRFYKLTVVRGIRNLRIVRLRNGQWEAVEFDQRNNSKISTNLLSAKQGYETFVKKLIELKLGTLPDQLVVDKQIEASYTSKKDYLSARPTIMDGYQFTVEFNIGNKFRVYQFRNPETYVRYYPAVEEFQSYVSILKAFEQDLVRK